MLLEKYFCICLDITFKNIDEKKKGKENGIKADLKSWKIAFKEREIYKAVIDQYLETSFIGSKARVMSAPLESGNTVSDFTI